MLGVGILFDVVIYIDFAIVLREAYALVLHLFTLSLVVHHLNCYVSSNCRRCMIVVTSG